jgi:hypothetical protein
MSGMNFQTVDPNKQFAGGELIPHGTLAWGVLKIKPFNFDMGLIATTAKQPGKDGKHGKYLDAEVTITEGPHARRKVFTRVSVAGTQAAVDAGFAAIRHILETGRGASDANPGGYVIGAQTPAGSDAMFMELDGLKVAVRIAVEDERPKNKDNPNGEKWPAKNSVGAFLSPNPASDTHKDFARLQAGDTAPKTVAPKAAAAASGAYGAPWTQPGNAAPATAPANPPPPAANSNMPWAKPSWAGSTAA